MTMKKVQAKKQFWLEDLQWSVMELHRPTKQPGPKRKDDRRLISGIIHVLQSGCRWQDDLPEYGPSTTVPVIPNKKNRIIPYPFKKRRYRQRNTIERMFYYLKDARRIATCYDTPATTFLNAICLMAVVYWWLH